ncbi:MAG: amidohydrolase family protein [Planctomycetota bacterium]
MHTRRLSDRFTPLVAPVAAALAALLALPTGAQDLTVTAPPQSRPVTITNATIHTVSGDVLENASITFNNGVITAINTEPAARASTNTRVIDAAGKHVYPGFIAPITELGLFEHGAVLATRDANETGQVSPEVVAATAVNPDTTLIPVARSNGILAFASLPTSGTVPGRASVMAAEGWTWKDMAIKEDAGLVVNWPSMRPNQNWFDTAPKPEQQAKINERLTLIDETFRQAIAYHASKATASDQPTDIRFEAMAKVLPLGAEPPKNPVLINAEELDQITAAVAWAKGLGLRPVIVGGRDAQLCTELLRRHDVPVIVGGTHRFPKRADAAYDDAYTLPAKLAAAGVRFCIASADRTGNERNLPYNAAMAAAFGLDHDAAVRAITLSTAEIYEIEKLGALEPGYRATLFIADGDALEITTAVTHAFIDGREIDLSNKQTELAEKYLEKYRQLGILRRDRLLND